jgi:post-segregation antitoxin (ccd killing protein)
VPTTRPRYTVTDTGELSEALDLAQRRWPDVGDRRQLLLRLAAAGRETIAAEVDAEESEQRRERQRDALARAAQLVDADELLGDAAWR